MGVNVAVDVDAEERKRKRKKDRNTQYPSVNKTAAVAILSPVILGKWRSG